MNSTGKWTWRSTLPPLLILFATSGCVTASTAPVANSYCKLAAPIGYDTTADSAETVKAIEVHNSVWVCVCEGDCPTSAAPSTGQ